MKNILFRIKQYIRNRKNKHLDELSSVLYQVFDKSDEKLLIHRVELKRRFWIFGDVIGFKIWLERPGLLIGRKGKDINKISDFLRLYYGRIISIKIIEYSPIRILSHYDGDFL